MHRVRLHLHVDMVIPASEATAHRVTTSVDLGTSVSLGACGYESLLGNVACVNDECWAEDGKRWDPR